MKVEVTTKVYPLKFATLDPGDVFFQMQEGIQEKEKVYFVKIEESSDSNYNALELKGNMLCKFGDNSVVFDAGNAKVVIQN